ncbi:MAG: hypothetical protein HKN59_05555 [Gammaproteobacteria bacterium]|nr:hypothetical protein [Gammaproteobacteria bacterium]
MSEKPEKLRSSEDGDQNVDKIREILFGAHIRDYDSRFSQLEQRLVAENEKMGQFLEKRLTGIATATQRELAGLSEHIENQNKKLSALQSETHSELESARHQIGERLNDLQHALDQETGALRSDLSEQYNSLIELVKKTRASMDESLTRESGRLEHGKVDREGLATLLADLSAQLRQDGSGE